MVGKAVGGKWWGNFMFATCKFLSYGLHFKVPVLKAKLKSDALYIFSFVGKNAIFGGKFKIEKNPTKKSPCKTVFFPPIFPTI